MIVVPL